MHDWIETLFESYNKAVLYIYIYDPLKSVSFNLKQIEKVTYKKNWPSLQILVSLRMHISLIDRKRSEH